LMMSAVIGVTGSVISLAMSKTMAKSSMGVQVIAQPQNQTEKWLYDVISKQAQQAGIGMPEVGIFQAPVANAFATGMNRNSALVAVSTGLLQSMTPDEVEAVVGHEVSHVANAFATGMNRNSALVAVSTGLLQSMTPDEVEAVVGHEVSHVANGDMVTMALMQGVLNTFVYFFATIIGYVVDRALSGNDERSGVGMGYYLAQMVAQIALGFLASIIVCWFSRRREFRADAGGASLAGREKMIGALRALQRGHEAEELPGQFAAFGINGGGIQKLFMTHPPLEERIAALQHNR
jgi:heat shock protein HtpX